MMGFMDWFEMGAQITLGATACALFVAATVLVWRQYVLRRRQVREQDTSVHPSVVAFDLGRAAQALALWWVTVSLLAFYFPALLRASWPPGGSFSMTALLYLYGIGGAALLFCAWQAAETWRRHVWWRIA